MIKLTKILENVGTGFKTTKTDVDPDTGKISWDVEYFPDFSEILENYNKLINDLDGTIKKHGIKDAAIFASLKNLKSSKAILLKTLQAKYPEYIKNLE